MRVVINERITIFDPTPEVIEWTEREMKFPNPEYAKKERLGFWTGKTPKYIYMYELYPNRLVVPSGCEDDVLAFVDISEWTKTVEFNRGPHPQLEFKSDVPLFDYQQKAVDEMVYYNTGILQAPAGSGKTQMGIALVGRFKRKALWLTHTVDLLNQSRDRALQYMDKADLGTITGGKVNVGRVLTFATIQTMTKLDLDTFRNEWDVIIVDECFPPNTPVETKDGLKPIQHIKPGDEVLTRNEQTGKLEYKEVEELQIRPLRRNLIVFDLNDGTKLVCTENHPIYTKNGYKKAGEITNDDEMCALRQRVRQFDIEQDTVSCNQAWGTFTSLFTRVFGKIKEATQCLVGRTSRKVETVDDRAESSNHIRKDEKEQSHDSTGNSRKSIKSTQKDQLSSINTRWKRTANEYSAKESVGFSDEIFSGGRVCYSDKEKVGRISDVLQNRHRDPGSENRHRGRRGIPQLIESSSCRQEEIGVLKWVGVDRITVYQPRSTIGFDELCPSGRVYNLNVKDNHNYFACGVLVHNCHRVAGSPTTVTMFSRVLNRLNARNIFGLSATVHRADGLIKTTFALVGPVRYIVPKEDVESRVMQVGIHPVFTNQRLLDCYDTDGTLIYARMVNELVHNNARNRLIVEELARNANHPSLILSDRLIHLEILMSLLPNGMWQNAVMISGKMTSKKEKEERQQALDDMRSGKKKYLFATYSLAKEGLDIPCLERLYLTTPQKDSAIITQSVGRVARVCKGKDNPIVYDFVDDFDYLKRAYKKRWTTYRKCGCYEVV